MINHEAIRQICPGAVNIVTRIDNTVQTGADSNGVPIFSICPIAYDAGGTQLAYDIPQAITISKVIACKQQARRLLTETDWSALPDVGLVNSEEFITYRSQVRALLIAPVADPTWPEQPSAVWS